jgi:uncharacterized protein YqfB (UPF0267 family)
VNDTFAGYKSFNVKRVELLNHNKHIDQRVFDGLINDLISTDMVAVVDNGASTFIPLSNYMVENDIVDFINNAGKKIYIHCVITGGQAMKDTIAGLLSILADQPAEVVVWQNEFFGPVELDGVAFVDTSFYATYSSKIKGIVTIARLNQDTFMKDMEIMVTNKMTFDEAMESDQFTMMPRHRLKKIQKSIYDQLQQIGI